MDKPAVLHPLIILTIFAVGAASASCPIDLSYVDTFPLDTSLCQDQTKATHCCQTLLSMIGVGIAQHLKDTSFFQLPDLNASSACFSQFRSKLASINIDPSWVSQCFPNISQFVTKSSSCAGMVTVQDWKEKVGMVTALDTSCDGHMNVKSQCNVCVNAGFHVTEQLSRVDPNNMKCFYFVAAAVANRFGPKDLGTASCILRLPLLKERSSDRGKVMRIVFVLLGALVVVVLAPALIVMSREWYERRREMIYHMSFEKGFREKVLPNAGVKWFRISELELATDGFLQTNMIGQGAAMELCTKGRFRMGLWLR